MLYRWQNGFLTARGMTKADRPLRGIFYILISMTAFSLMNVFAKNMSGHYDVLQVVFFRSLFLLPPCAAVILLRRKPKLFYTQDWRGHFWRGVVGLACMLCVFYSLKLLPLADAVAIGFLGPACATVAAMLWLREKASWHRWLAIVAGFVGVIIMAQPGAAPVDRVGFAVAVLGSMLYGLTMVRVRLLRGEHALTTVWIFGVFSTVVLGCTLPFVWLTPTADDWAQLAATGFFAFFGQLYVTKAYQCAPAATISPFNYTSLLWAVLFGYLWFEELPTPQILAGAFVVILAGLYAAWFEAHQHKRQPAPPL